MIIIVFGNYNINLISNNEKYDIRKYNQKLNMSFTVNQGMNYIVLEIDSNNKINQKLKLEAQDKEIQFEAEEIYPYLLLEEKKDLALYINEIIEEQDDTKLEIDDYEKDKNYYIGLNYTENDNKTSLEKYTEDNLKKVIINYYGYDYNLTEFVKPKKYDISINASAQLSSRGNITSQRENRRTYYSRTDTITIKVSGINKIREQYPEFRANSTWKLNIFSPNNSFSNYFYETGTTAANANKGISVSLSNNILNVTGNDSTFLENGDDEVTISFSITFRNTSQNNINNIKYSNLTTEQLQTIITVGDYTPYGTISDTEQQILVSYNKCIPVDENGNITLKLIDNPFFNRPLEMGFNGWKTNNTKYSKNISTNKNTYEQTLTTNLNNIKNEKGEYIIDLYPDWITANIVFVSSSGNSNNDGKTTSTPINNDWNTINTKLNANKKNATNASSREVNIVVLMNGTLNITGLTGPNTPYTLTSLYDGVNYGNSNTYLNVGSSNVTLDSDLQLDYVYVYSSSTYLSPRGTFDGTTSVTPCIYGNMYNLRIGRGVMPTNSNNCTWGQVQGGYYNNNKSEYKLVIESGKYYTTQLYRAGSDSNAYKSVTANGILVIGSDIDRKENNNESLRIYSRIASKTTTATNYPYTDEDDESLITKMIIKSGSIGVDYFDRADTSDGSERNYAGIYVGGYGQTGYDKSDRKIIVEGGNIANIIGGLNVDSSDMYKTYIYVKDGNIYNITGGAGYTHTYGNRIIQVTGGCIKYSISGGSNGVAASSSSNNGQLTGETLIYIGGNAEIGASYTIDDLGNKNITETDVNSVLYGVNAGNVCGGANGNSGYAGQTDGSYIIIDGNAVIHNNVFGGGNYGIIGAPTGTRWKSSNKIE